MLKLTRIRETSTLCLLLPYVVCLASKFVDEYEERSRLTKALLRNYDRFQVPSKSSKHPVNVTMTLWPYDILMVNEAKSSIKFSGWIDLRWVDYRMKWKPAEYGNVTHTFIPSSKLWLPALDIVYKKDERQSKRCDDCYLKIDSTGETLWGQYFSYTFPCTINVKYLPFDIQKRAFMEPHFRYCEMELANWFLDDRMMDVYPRDSVEALDLSVFLPNVEWELLNVTVTRKRGFFNYGYFASVAYRLYIKRKPFFYVAVLVVPSLMITLTAVIGFHLPSSGSGVHEEKVQIGVTAVLSVFILQLGVANKLPPSSDEVPLIGIYYSSMVMILSLSIISSTFIIVIEKQGIYGKPVPDILQLVFLWRARPNRHIVKPRHLVSHGSCIFAKNNASCMCRSASGNACESVIQNQLQKDGKSSLCVCVIGVRRDMNVAETQEDKNNFEFAVDGKAKRKLPPNYDVSSELSRSLNEMLAEIRSSVVFLDERLHDQEREKQIRRDWNALADVVERISLAFFITAAFTALLMFFNHGWY